MLDGLWHDWCSCSENCIGFFVCYFFKFWNKVFSNSARMRAFSLRALPSYRETQKATGGGGGHGTLGMQMEVESATCLDYFPFRFATLYWRMLVRTTSSSPLNLRQELFPPMHLLTERKEPLIWLKFNLRTLQNLPDLVSMGIPTQVKLVTNSILGKDTRNWVPSLY